MGDDKTFEKLNVWQESQELAVEVYRLTRSFPESEKYGLVDQIRRASVSVSANIAEGYGRNTKKDSLHFYRIAYGSLLEVKNFIYLSYKLGFLQPNEDVNLLGRIVTCQKLLNGFMRSVSNK